MKDEIEKLRKMQEIVCPEVNITEENTKLYKLNKKVFKRL